jgi:hypothetical protein
MIFQGWKRWNPKESLTNSSNLIASALNPERKNEREFAAG